MKPHIAWQGTLSGTAAVLMSLAVAGQVMAAGWSGPVPVSSDDVFVQDLCASRGDAIVAYVNDYTYVAVKRSTDGGGTWRQRFAITGGAPLLARLACRGQHVDLAWLDNYRVRYTSSENGGRSFALSRRISPWRDDEVVDLDMARGPAGLVAVVWEDDNSKHFPDVTSRVRVRVSTDGGATFGATQTLAQAGGVSVAIGDGVIYVAYLLQDSNGTIAVRRSLDDGATWSAPVDVTANSWGGGASLAAIGSDAYIGYSQENRSNHWVTYRRTTDAGETWSTPISLSSPNGKPAGDVHFSLDGDIAQVAFIRCGDQSCNDHGSIIYRKSPNGIQWSSPETVESNSSLGQGDLGGLTFASRPIVAYTQWVNTAQGTETRAISRYRLP